MVGKLTFNDALDILQKHYLEGVDFYDLCQEYDYDERGMDKILEGKRWTEAFTVFCKAFDLNKADLLYYY